MTDKELLAKQVEKHRLIRSTLNLDELEQTNDFEAVFRKREKQRMEEQLKAQKEIDVGIYIIEEIDSALEEDSEAYEEMMCEHCHSHSKSSSSSSSSKSGKGSRKSKAGSENTSDGSLQEFDSDGEMINQKYKENKDKRRQSTNLHMSKTEFDSQDELDYYNLQNQATLKRQLQKKRCIVLPNAWYKKSWDNFLATLIIYVVMILPFKFSFIDDMYPVWDDFDNFVDICFTLDIVFNFFTAYVDQEDNVIISRRKIICNYLKMWFWIDLISVFPLDLILESGKYNILVRITRLNKLYKLFKITKLFRSMRMLQNQNNFWSKMYEFLKLNKGFDRLILNLSAIFIFCHVFACVWHLFAVMEEEPISWIWRL